MTTPADTKTILSSLAGRRVTATDIANILETSRNTANARLKAGLEAEDIIRIARGLHFNPLGALLKLNKISRDEVFDYFDSEGKQLAAASIEELTYRLADELLSPIQKVELGAQVRNCIEARSSRTHLRAVKNPHTAPDQDVNASYTRMAHNAAADSNPLIRGTLDDFTP